MIFLNSLVFLAVCFAMAPAFAKIQIGEILAPQGMRATVNGKRISAPIPLFWGDRLLTGPDTTLDVVVYPSFSLKLRSSTEVKMIGNVIEKQGKALLASTAVQALRGKIQGQVSKNSDVQVDLKVFARRTISSIRGTTFEIDVADLNEAAEAVSVFEGQVDVDSIVSDGTVPTAVAAGMEVTSTAPEAKPAQSQAPNDLIPQSVVDTRWKQNEAKVLSAHAKEAKKYRELLARDVKSVVATQRKDARGMFNNIKGTYDQFKKKK